MQRTKWAMPTVLQTDTKIPIPLWQIGLRASQRDGMGIRRPQPANANRCHPDMTSSWAHQTTETVPQMHLRHRRGQPR